MRLRKFPQLLRILFCLAVCQVVAPSMVAVADAWRMDQRQPYAHIEAESGAGCVVVHHDDCALCAFLSAGSAPPAAPCEGWPQLGDAAGCTARAFVPLAGEARYAPGPRAPPST